MALTNSLVVLFYNCCATADILTKLLQQCILFFIVLVILGHNQGNSQVSVYRTIDPTLVANCKQVRLDICVILWFSRSPKPLSSLGP